MPSLPAPNGGWIPQDEYDRIQARVPIVCVDLLPLDRSREAVGLIRRATPAGEGWCLTGGAVKRNESLLAAISRHVRSTLGSGFTYELTSTEPLTIAEYFPEGGAGELHDPRKHAVALTYTASCEGEAQAQGEAMEFRWFGREELAEVQFGFGQGAVVERLLQLLER